MSHELWLKTGRNVLLERASGLTHTPREVSKRWKGSFAIDPLTGHLTMPVTWSGTGSYTWSYDDADAYTSGSLHGRPFPAHKADGPFQAETTTALDAHHGFFFTFLLWQDQGPEVWCRFGQRYSLKLLDGVMELYRWEQVGPSTGSGLASSDWRLVGAAYGWDQDEWFNRPHTIYVYAIGDRIAVRRLGAKQRLDGILVTDTLAAANNNLALAPATIRVTSTGRVAFFAAPERHATELAVVGPLYEIPEGSSAAPETGLGWLGPDPTAPTIWLYTAEGKRIAQTPEGDETEDDIDTGPYENYQYVLAGALTSATGPNLYITRVRVNFPAVSGPDGLTGTDLLALPGVAVQAVTENRTLQPEGNSLTFTLKATPGTISAYTQANMRGAWCPGGVQRMDFLTDEPKLSLGAADVYEYLEFACRDMWKRFEHVLWSGGETYAGKPLADCYRDAAYRAGLAASDVVITAGGYNLPEEEGDDEPLFDFRPGETVAGVLNYLRENFGAEHYLRFRPDGKFYAEDPPSTHSGVTFYWSAPGLETTELGTTGVNLPVVIHILCGTSEMPRILRPSWDEWLSETSFANEVWVVGRDRDGEPLVAYATDWDSINNDSVFNYVGEPRRMVIADAGLTTQAVVDWVCYQVWSRARNLRQGARFRSIFIPGLLPGDIVTIDGRGEWRIVTMSSSWALDQSTAIGTYEVEPVR